MEEKKSKKWNLWLIIIILSIVAVLFVFKDKLIGEKNIVKYELKKYVDYTYNIDGIYDMKYDGEYFVLSAYARLTENNYFSVYKNRKKINLNEFETAQVGLIPNTDKYYSSIKSFNGKYEANIIDYKNGKISSITYDSLNPTYYENQTKGNYLIAKKNNKFGLINADGQEILPFEYDKISFTNGIKYLLALKDGKVGVVDFSGETIVPFEYGIYSITSYGNFLGQIINFNNKDYFILKKDNDYYALNELNKVILKGQSKEIFFDYDLAAFKIEHEVNHIVTKIDYYSLDGNFIKTINIDKNWEVSSGIKTKEFNQGFRIFNDKNNLGTVYMLNNKYEITKYENIYYERKDDAEQPYNKYYINNKIYVTKINDKYELYTILDNNKIGTYSYISFVEMTYDFEKPIVDAIVACQDTNKCGLIDLSGNILYDNKYEFFRGDDSYDIKYLKYNNSYVFLDVDGPKNIECENESSDFLNDINNINDSWITFYNNSFRLKRNIYSYNCNKINDKETRNIFDIENNFVIAEINNMKEKTTPNGRDMYNYYIFDNNNKLVNYINKDEAKVYLYLGYGENTLFFLTDKGIYTIEI